MARAAKATETVKGKAVAAGPTATKAAAKAEASPPAAKPKGGTSKSTAAVEKPTKAAAVAKKGKGAVAKAEASPPAAKPKSKTSKSAAAVEKPTKAAALAKKGKGAVARAAALPAKAPVVSLRQLATEMADGGGMSRPEAHMLATKLIGSVLDHVKAGARVKLAGLGVIEIRDRPARTARNPATGEPVQVAASRKITFRPAKELKEVL